MRQLECDVVVVGAGPSGSLAARAAAENDSKVLILEEHAVPGLPVYCAEALSLQGIIDAGAKPKPPITCQEVTKARVYVPNKTFVELTSKDWKGYNLNRDIFDRTLAENAVEAGADLMVSTRVLSVIKEGNTVIGVRAKEPDGDLTIKSKIVIGADGHASIVRKTANLGRYFPDYVTCAQYKLGGLELDEPWVNDFILGSKVSPGGYAWVFPKSSDQANVGLGVRRIHKEPPINYLQRFIKSDSRFKGSKILLVNGGICPVSGVLSKIVADGVMLVGDSAGQLISATGAGIHSGVAAGKIAGEIASLAIQDNDLSTNRLSEYVNRFNEYWGKRIADSRKVVEILDKFSDENLNTLAKVVTDEDVINLANGIAVTRTLAKIVTRAPIGIIGLISAYLRG
jgi:digeranylgeranylglycerophospholipid reductase